MNQLYRRMRAVLPLAFAWMFVLPLFGVVEAAGSAATPLERLIQGNQRYVNSTTVCHEDWTAKRSALLEGQKPFAVIVACSDSRVPPELVFDQSLGDLFIVRVAGNIVDDFAIGSIEYGVSVLGANYVLVLGHSNCGAVRAALDGMTFDNHIQSVVSAIQPAVAATKGESGDKLANATKANVKLVEDRLKTSKPVLAKLIEKGTLRISGGYYDLATGKVEFLDKP